MFSDPKYSFLVCQKIFVASKKVNIFHNSSPNYKQHRQLGTSRLSPSKYCPYDAPKEYLFANLPTKPRRLSVYAWELSQHPSTKSQCTASVCTKYEYEFHH